VELLLDCCRRQAAYRALKSKKRLCRARRPASPRRKYRNRAGELRSIARGVFRELDANSLASLKKHYKDIDLLIPEQLHAVTRMAR